MGLSLIREYQKKGRAVLCEIESYSVLEPYQIPMAKHALANNRAEAKKLAESIGSSKFVLKVQSPDFTHKTEQGLVETSVPSDKVSETYDTLLSRASKINDDENIKGILIQEEIDKSREFVIGSVDDPTFGQSIMFGLGGIFTELLRDVCFRLPPLSEQDAIEMIKGIKHKEILGDFRGEDLIEINCLVETLLRVSSLIEENPEIVQLDLNPVMVDEDGAKVVDALIILNKKSEGKSVGGEFI